MDKSALLRRLTVWVALAASALVSLGGCRPAPDETSQRNAAARPSNTAPSQTAVPESGVQFVNVTQQTGIDFVHHNGAFGVRLAPENMGSGAAFFDYDDDDYTDIFLVNGRDWSQSEIDAYRDGSGREQLKRYKVKIPTRPAPKRSSGALYRNLGDGTFRDVTASSGLDITMQGMGVATGDYDNDGRTDLYVTGWPRNYLFHNEGAGKFREVSDSARVRDEGWGTSAAWLDYDKDGKLDLFVGRYYQWTPATEAYKEYRGQKAYSAPEQYRGQCSHLYRNLGNGRFADVSKSAGICSDDVALQGKALGVTIGDYDNDGWLDIAVANDRQANFLFRNNGKGGFSEVGLKANFALGDGGQARAGMGIDAGDIDHSDRESVVIGNFSGEPLGLHRNMGNGLFTDIAPTSEVGRVSLPFLTFGCLLVDVDNDGWLDIMAANGHVNDIDPKMALQPPLLFHNERLPQRLTPAFRFVGFASGAALRVPMMGRGLAGADIDLDGDDDILITTNGGPPHLLRNDGGNRNNAIRVVLRGTKSNRDAIGALVWAQIGSDLVRRRVRSGSSYLSQSELPVTLGLGRAAAATIVVRWPSGKLAQFPNVAANQIVTIDEDKGIVRRQPFPRIESATQKPS